VFYKACFIIIIISICSEHSTRHNNKQMIKPEQGQEGGKPHLLLPLNRKKYTCLGISIVINIITTMFAAWVCLTYG